ncbi:MAG TPA: glycosyltransferase family 4 protein [Candidatus Hydrogenedentes bacterium]|nr:glycosyltransferase family 4 protein [Candidatus Hydrogenedentota bacterium]
MRPLFIDLLFSWPPHGGGDVDMYHVVKGAAGAGLDPLLVLLKDNAWERGQVQAELPFEHQTIAFDPDRFTAEEVAEALRALVAAVQPAFVFLGQGFFLKHLLVRAVPDSVPVISRLHAHEALCFKDITRFRDGKPCPNAWFSTPDTCARCAMDYWAGAIRRNQVSPWLRELLITRPWLPEIQQETRAALKKMYRALVYNQDIADALSPLQIPCQVIPSGIDLNHFPASPWDNVRREPPVVFMPGRAEDPVKGFSVLLRACGMLIDRGISLELRATIAPSPDLPEWVAPLGWLSRKDLYAHYAEAAVVAVPSVWEEPFGLTALEAMAIGRPVIASAVGGLRETVRHGETGLLVPPGDPVALAEAIQELLTHPERAQDMGTRGSDRVKQYSWDHIMRQYYYPLWRPFLPEIPADYA